MRLQHADGIRQIVATGQTPQSELLESFSPDSIDQYGFVKTRKTLQIESPHQLENIFAVGDVAATAAHKAARPGAKQAALVVTNVQHLLRGEELEQYAADRPGIHLTLGIVRVTELRVMREAALSGTY